MEARLADVQNGTARLVIAGVQVGVERVIDTEVVVRLRVCCPPD